MEILIPRGAGKKVEDIEVQEVSIGNRKMEMRWSTNGSSIVVDAHPTASKKKGAVVEVGNGYVIVRAFDEDKSIRSYEVGQTFNVGFTEDLNPKLSKIVEAVILAAEKCKKSKPDAEKPVISNVDELF